MATHEEETKEITDYLGLTRIGIAERCSEFPMFMIRRVANKQETVPTDLVDFIKSFYSYNELVYFATQFLTEKTEKIMNKPETAEFIRNMGRKL